MQPGTERGLLELYSRVGALEANQRHTDETVQELRSAMRRIEINVADMDTQMRAQSAVLTDVAEKLRFVDKLEEFLMKAETVTAVAKKVVQYAGTIAKVATVAGILAAAYLSGGLSAVVAAAGQAVAVLVGA